MATIERRTSETGQISFRVKIRLRGHPTEHASFSRMTDAKLWAQSTEAAIREGRHFKTPEGKRQTVADMVDLYLEEVAPQRPRNLVNTRRHLLWWKSKIGQMLVSDVTPAVVSRLRNELVSKPGPKGKQRAGATVVRYLASLSHAFTIAMKDWCWVTDNPVLKISKPRQSRGRERYLSDDERQRLLAACDESTSRFLKAVVVLAMSTGMRRGEIMAMTWTRVDLNRKMIYLTETKNDTSRAIPLAALALEMLVELSKVRRIDTDLVFYGTDPSKPVDLKKPWETAVRKAGLLDFRFHDLRHTAASYLAMNGATTLEIAALLGHKTLTMVKRYSHLANSHTSVVLTSMNNKIFGGMAA